MKRKGIIQVAKPVVGLRTVEGVSFERTRGRYQADAPSIPGEGMCGRVDGGAWLAHGDGVFLYTGDTRASTNHSYSRSVRIA